MSSSSRLPYHWLRVPSSQVQRQSARAILQHLLDEWREADGDGDDAALEGIVRMIAASGASPCVVEVIVSTLRANAGTKDARAPPKRPDGARFYITVMGSLLLRERREFGDGDGELPVVDGVISAAATELAIAASGCPQFAAVGRGDGDACARALAMLVDGINDEMRGDAARRRRVIMDAMIDSLGNAMASDAQSPAVSRALAAFATEVAKFVRERACAADSPLRLALRTVCVSVQNYARCGSGADASCASRPLDDIDGDDGPGQLGRTILSAAVAGVASCDAGSAESRDRACTAVADIVDALESIGDGEGRAMEGLLGVVVDCCVRFQRERAPIRRMLHTGLRIARLCHPDALVDYIVDLFGLMPFAGVGEALPLMKLVLQLLNNGTRAAGADAHRIRKGRSVPASAARFLLQGACASAASPPPGAQDVATELLATLRRLCSPDAPAAGMTLGTRHSGSERGRSSQALGEFVSMAFASGDGVEEVGWPGPWCAAYHVILASEPQACLESICRAAVERPDIDSDEAVPSVATAALLGFVLTSSCARTGRAEADLEDWGIVSRIMRASSTVGNDMLPITLMLMESTDDDERFLSLLKLLPDIGAHYAGAAAVDGVLRSFESAEALRPLRLVLMTRLWEHTGRGFRKLCDTLAHGNVGGSASSCPGEDLGISMRLARMMCIRDVCELEPESGIEFVHAIDEGLRDSGSSAVRSLALQSIYHLCAEDAMDWKSAAMYVQRRYPAPPSDCGEETAAWAKIMTVNADFQEEPETAAAMLHQLASFALQSPSDNRVGWHAAVAALAASDAAVLTQKSHGLDAEEWTRLSLLLRSVSRFGAAVDDLVSLLQTGLIHEESMRRVSGRRGTSETSVFRRQAKMILKTQTEICETALLSAHNEGDVLSAELGPPPPTMRSCAAGVLLVGMSPQCARSILGRNSDRYRSKRTVYARALAAICGAAEIATADSIEVRFELDIEAWDAFMSGYLSVLASDCKGDEELITNVSSVLTKLQKIVEASSPAAASCAIYGIGSMVRTCPPRGRLQVDRATSFLRSSATDDPRLSVRRAAAVAMAASVAFDTNGAAKLAHAVARGVPAEQGLAALVPGDQTFDTWSACIASWSALCSNLFRGSVRRQNERETHMLIWLLTMANGALSDDRCAGGPMPSIRLGIHRLLNAFTHGYPDGVQRISAPGSSSGSVASLSEQQSDSLLAQLVECYGNIVNAVARHGTSQEILEGVVGDFVEACRSIIGSLASNEGQDCASLSLLSILPSVLFTALDHGIVDTAAAEELLYFTYDSFAGAADRKIPAAIVLAPVTASLVDGSLVCGIPLPLRLPTSIVEFAIASLEDERSASVSSRALAALGNLLGAAVLVAPYSCRRASRTVEGEAAGVMDESTTSSMRGLAGPIVTQQSAMPLVSSILHSLHAVSQSSGHDHRVRYAASGISARALATAWSDARGADQDGHHDACATSVHVQEGSILASVLRNVVPHLKDRDDAAGGQASGPPAGVEASMPNPRMPGVVCIAASLRCLSVCKALPLVGWQGIAMSLIDRYKHDATVMSDLLSFLVKQSTTGKAFTSTLSDAVGRCWQEDATGLREATVRNLPVIFANIPLDHIVELLHVLARFVSGQGRGGSGPASWSGDLWLACVTMMDMGMASVANLSAPADHADEALRDALVQMLAVSGPAVREFPHPSLHGFGLQTQKSLAEFWASALRRLRKVRQQTLVESLPTLRPPCRIYASCRLAATGILPWNHVVDLRSWCLSSAHDADGLVCALECARALAAGPFSTRKAFLIDGLDAAAMAADTAHALCCMSCVLVSFSNPDLRGLVEVQPESGIVFLPHALPLLMNLDAWRAGTTGHAIATRVLRLMQMPSSGVSPALVNAVMASARKYIASEAASLF